MVNKLSAQHYFKVATLATLSLLISACAPSRKQDDKPIQTMTCAGEFEISFYEQRDFDKQCIAHIERKRENAVAE